MEVIQSHTSPAKELSSLSKVKILAAVAATGNKQDMQLALQLVDAQPCSCCNYIHSHCKCS